MACGRYGEWSGAWRVLVGKPKGKRSLGRWEGNATLTLRLLMSYIYGAPSKARNANVVYIWTYVWHR